MALVLAWEFETWAATIWDQYGTPDPGYENERPEQAVYPVLGVSWFVVGE